MAANFLTLRPLGRTPSGSQHCGTSCVDDRKRDEGAKGEGSCRSEDRWEGMGGRWKFD
jgi:hypothetical protein